MKKVLLLTSKIPNENKDLDGGTATVLNLIRILSKKNSVDALFYDVYGMKNLYKCSGLNKMIIRDGKKLDYRNTDEREETRKFIERINMADLICADLKSLIDDYDICIIIHCSMAFKISNFLSEEQMKKIVLFPMFLTPSYIKAGNNVPKEYRKLEEQVLKKVSTIITPSVYEKYQLIDDYNVEKNHIHIIPRSVGIFVGSVRYRQNLKKINICNVSSFRSQKNIIDSIKCIDILRVKYPNVHLYIVGYVHQNEIYDECNNYVLQRNMTEYVSFIAPMNEQKLKEFYSKMDISISTSLVETFGRTIFESMSMGIPTIVLESLIAVKEMIGENKGIRFAATYKDMAATIGEIIDDNDVYYEMSKAAYQISELFSLEKESQEIMNIIGA